MGLDVAERRSGRVVSARFPQERREMQITEDDVAQAMRDWAEVTTTRDFARLWSMESGAIGFGYRTLAVRRMAAIDQATFVRMNEQFFANLESYRLELESVQTAVAGDLGLAWPGAGTPRTSRRRAVARNALGFGSPWQCPKARPDGKSSRFTGTFSRLTRREPTLVR
jgi:hypothetical protein